MQFPTPNGIACRFHKRLKKNTIRTLSLGMALAMVFTSSFVMPATAVEKTASCGHEEHKHDDSCYEKKLICELEETEDQPAHEHTDECYTIEKTLTCGLEESEGHTHDESCYDEEGNLICGLEESDGHTHTDECYTEEKILTCDKSTEEVKGHKHTDECYEKVLTCEKEEHEHTLICYTNTSADLESQSDWESTIPANLTGSWATDLVTVAKSQVGYRESEYNYQVEEPESEDGEERALGYTRYGAWYGAPYADWCAMFVSFCLNYAGIPSSAIPYAASVPSWVSQLQAKGMFAYASDYVPKKGDIIFFTYDGDGQGDHVGIVESVKKDKDSGVTTIKTIEGNSGDYVKINTYDMSDSTILGYGKLPKLCSCYKIQRTVTCGQEVTGHVHDYSCYDDDNNLICGKEQTSGHIHSLSCYNVEQVKVCKDDCKCSCHG
jgi:hypothetical protein